MPSSRRSQDCRPTPANQNAFTETGAQSLNLSVVQQQTNSLRSVIGAQIGGSMDLGWREKLAHAAPPGLEP